MIQTAEQLAPRLLQASIALAIAALLVVVCVRLLRVRSPRAEQWAWLLVLLQGVMLAQVVVPLPASLLAVAPADVPPAMVDVALEEKQPTPVRHEGVPADADLSQPPMSSDDAAELPAMVVDTAVPAPLWSSNDISWRALALAIWGIGLMTVLGVGISRYRTFIRRIGHGQPVHPEWEAEWQQVLQQARLRAPVRLLVAADVGPACCRRGGKNMVVVPKMLWMQLAGAQRCAILRHELEHFRRNDLWWTLLARTLAAVHWFNPLAWWAIRKFEAQGEFACDQAAARGTPLSFAELLLRLGAGRAPTMVGVKAMTSGGMYERIQRLLTDQQPSPRWRNLMPVTTMLLVTALVTLRFESSALPSSAAEDPPREAAAAEEPLPERALLRLGTDAFATRGHVSDIAFSPDGKSLAAIEANTPVRNVRIFSVATGQEVKQLMDKEGKQGRITTLAFSPNGKQLFCGEMGGVAMLWDLTNQKVLFQDTVHLDQINDVAFSPDGTRLATAGKDGGLKVLSATEPKKVIWELQQGTRLKEHFPGMTAVTPAGVQSVAFTPDGTKLVAGNGADGKVSVWNLSDGKLLHSFVTMDKAVRPQIGTELHSVAVTPDGMVIMTSVQLSVKRDATNLTLGPKNLWAPRVDLWDLTTGKHLNTLSRPDEYGSGEAGLSPDGKQVAIVLYGQLVIRALDPDKESLQVPLPGQFGGMPTFSSDGKLVAMRLGNSIAMIDATSGERLHHEARTSTDSILSAAWSPTADRIVTGGSEGGVRVWNASTGDLVWHREMAPANSPIGDLSAAHFVAFTADGTQVLAAGGRDSAEGHRGGTMVVYDAAQGQIVREISIPRPVQRGAVSHDGKIVVLATSFGSFNDTRLHGIDISTGRILYTTPSGEDEMSLWSAEAIEFLPDSSAFRIATVNSEIIQFDTITGMAQQTVSIDWRSKEQQLANQPAFPQLVKGAFSETSATLVTSSFEYVYQWDAATGKQQHKMLYPQKFGCILCASPDGKSFAATDMNLLGVATQDLIRLYETHGEELLTLAPKNSRANIMVFSPDGSKLFTGFDYTAPIIWDVKLGE